MYTCTDVFTDDGYFYGYCFRYVCLPVLISTNSKPDHNFEFIQVIVFIFGMDFPYQALPSNQAV